MTRCRPYSGLEPLERRLLFANGSLDVEIGGAARAARFIDTDGTTVTVRMRGQGAATVHFTGEGLAQAPSRRTVVVSGTGLALASVTATGVSYRSSMAFSASGGDGRFGLGPVTTDGPIGGIIAREAVLTGGLSTGGPARQIRLLRAENGAITLGGGAGTSSLAISEAAVDCDLTSAVALRRLDLGTWTGGDGGDVITAPSIDRLTVGGVFSGDLTVSSAGRLDFDTIENSTINVSGSIGSVMVAPFSTTRNLRMNVGGDIGSAAFATLTTSRIYAGVRPLPDESPVPTLSDFVAPSSIRRLQMSGGLETSDCVIAARFMGRVLIRGVIDLFGTRARVVADRIDRLKLNVFAGLHRLVNLTYKDIDSETVSRGTMRVDAL